MILLILILIQIYTCLYLLTFEYLPKYLIISLYYFIDRTAEDKDNWMKCINDAIHKVRQSVEASTGHIAPVWMPDKAVTHCQNIICKKQFTVIRRRHHCRNW